MKYTLNGIKRIWSHIGLMLTLLFFISSCSTDSVADIEMEDAITEETETPINDPVEMEEDENEPDIPDTGAITFEDGFILTEERSLASLVLTQAEYNAFIEGEGDLRNVSEKVYQYLKDDFDFLIILSIEATQPPDLFYGRSTLVQNQVQGLGNSTYTNAPSYGSAERLKSIIYMPRSEYIKTGPFLHEIAHTWGNKDFIPTTVGGHWGYASVAGQLGGFDELIELGGNSYRGRLNGNNGFGTFANGGNSVPYGQLELYLMGLISLDELDPIQVAINPESGSSAGEFTADAINTHTAASLIAEHGERVPSYENSQKAFKALTVVISKEVLSQEKMDGVNSDLENFSRASAPDANWGTINNFWQATQGKASFDFTVLQTSIK